MRRVALAVAGTAAGLGAVLSYRTPAPAVAQPAGPAAVGATAGTVTRTLTGSTVSTRWGPVQVAVVLSDGRIAQVQVLQQPDGHQRDRQINAAALPRLQAETLAAQSAEVDTVSGATYTSQGYVGSLQSALDQR